MRLLLTALLLIGCEKIVVQEKIVEKLVPAPIDLTNYPHAQAELKEHVDACGPGVLQGQEGENRCSYTVTPESLILHPNERTGFIHDPDFFLKNPAQFSLPKQVNNPDTWHIAGPMPEVTLQTGNDCWAQATRNGAEIAICSADGKCPDTSIQQVIDCSNAGSYRSGGFMSAFDHLLKMGSYLTANYPYINGDQKCSVDFTKPPAHTYLESPYVGNSLLFSRARKANPTKFGLFGGDHKEQMENTKAMMIAHNSPAIVTIAAISQSGGIIDSCTAKNSWGNHMEVIKGWYPNPKEPKETVANVRNSWGPDHGQDGDTHLVWERNGNLCRGLGMSARVVVYKPECLNQPDAFTGPNRTFLEGTAVQIGRKPNNKQTCSWTPTQGLSDPTSCAPYASPNMSTEYHLTATTECGTATAMVLVTPIGPKYNTLNVSAAPLRTPYGVISFPRSEIK